MKRLFGSKPIAPVVPVAPVIKPEELIPKEPMPKESDRLSHTGWTKLSLLPKQFAREWSTFNGSHSFAIEELDQHNHWFCKVTVKDSDDMEPFYFRHRFVSPADKSSIVNQDESVDSNTIMLSNSNFDRSLIPPNASYQLDLVPSVSLPNVTLVFVTISKTSKTKHIPILRPKDLCDYIKTTLNGYPMHTSQTFVVLYQNSYFSIKVQRMETNDADQPIGKLISQGICDSSVMVVQLDWDESTRRFVTLQQEFDQLASIMKNDMDFTSLGIGGLNKELMIMFRRAFVSRMYSHETIAKLGCSHTKGILLYGPPGCGKTLIARKIGALLHVDNPKIVNGPELLSKFVGESEANMRNLFGDAIRADPSDPKIHLIVFDEIDAIARARGSMSDNTGARDGLVTQLLSLMDGVNRLNNILVIGMTNRKELLDEALLRPGRMEVHIEIGLPDERGRLDVLTIHTKSMMQNNLMSADVDLEELAHDTSNYTGAELEALVRSAQSHAMMDHVHGIGNAIDESKLLVTSNHFQKALMDIHPAFGMAHEKWIDYQRGGIIEFDPDSSPGPWLEWCNATSNAPMKTLLIHGPSGCGCTAFVAYLAQHTSIRCVKWLTVQRMNMASDTTKLRTLEEVFSQAFTCEHSLIIIDDIEDWFNYVSPHQFSGALSKSLMRLCRRPPSTGRHTKIICTTHLDIDMGSFFHDMGWINVFSTKHELPLVCSLDMFPEIKEDDSIVLPIPIKTLINLQ